MITLFPFSSFSSFDLITSTLAEQLSVAVKCICSGIFPSSTETLVGKGSLNTGDLSSLTKIVCSKSTDWLQPFAVYTRLIVYVLAQLPFIFVSMCVMFIKSQPLVLNCESSAFGIASQETEIEASGVFVNVSISGKEGSRVIVKPPTLGSKVVSA